MNLIETEICRKILAIVCFGPALPVTGLRPAEYYQVTIDPNMCSPSGMYIRFGFHYGDEITGWQRVQAMTIVEILGDSNKKLVAGIEGYSEDGKPISMMMVENEEG